jgi:hypothetical protein
MRLTFTVETGDLVKLFQHRLQLNKLTATLVSVTCLIYATDLRSGDRGPNVASSGTHGNLLSWQPLLVSMTCLFHVTDHCKQ